MIKYIFTLGYFIKVGEVLAYDDLESVKMTLWGLSNLVADQEEFAKEFLNQSHIY